MAKKLLDSKILYMLLSVLLAIALWFYVSTVQGEMKTNLVKNIPISFIGTDVLQENGLMITGEAPTANIDFRASITTLTKLKADTVTLTIDVSKIVEPGKYTMGYEVALPSGVSSSMVTIVERDPTNASFSVERYASVDVPVKGEFDGGMAEGYMNYSGFVFTPQTVNISGQADLVNLVKEVLVTVSGENLSETVQGAMPYQLIGYDNQPLGDLDIVRAPETVETTFEVLKEVEIPLTVDFVAGGGATEQDISWSISPQSLRIAGAPEDLEALNELTVATINLADIEGTESLTYTIPLAKELRNVSGVSEAAVTVTVNGLSTRTFDVTDFTLLNIPKGYNATVRTQSLTVTVRGTAGALELASINNLRVTADLSDINLASGQYTVPAKVQFDGVEGADVLGTDYQLVVRLSKS